MDMDTEKKEDSWCSCSGSSLKKIGAILFGIVVLAYIVLRLMG